MIFARGFRGLFASTLFATGLASLATAQVTTNIVNNGTSTDGLVRIQNVNGTGGAEMELATQEPPPGLIASQSPAYSDFPVFAVWYSQNYAAIGRDYAVTVSAQPAGGFPEYQPGAMGWLDTTTGRGIAFRAIPSAEAGSFQVSVIDFQAAAETENVSVTNLFNLDGTPASLDFGSAAVGTGDYNPDEPASFILQFNPPAAADLTALATATARISAKVLQTPAAGGPPVQVGDTVELLTDLTAPAVQRFGYLASWGTSFVPGEPIATFNRLALLGNVEILHRPPAVAITSPPNGASFMPPTNVTLVATATAFDGATISKVEFYQGTTLVGTALNAPFSASVPLTTAGDLSFTAKATDSTGATTTSTPVTVEVLHQPPTVTIINPPDGTQYQLPANITLTATASAFDGAAITSVEFFQAAAAQWFTVGTATNPPYSVPVSIASAGSYTFIAVATDSETASTTSASVTIQVTGGGIPGQAARLSNPQALPSSSDFQIFAFTLTGTPGATYVTETTGDYLTWKPVATNQLAGNTVAVSVPRGTNRFLAFRARTDAGGPPPSEVVIINPQALPSSADFATFAFKVMGLIGKSYRVETTSDWLKWTAVESGTGTAAVMNFSFPSSGKALFYRVIVP